MKRWITELRSGRWKQGFGKMSNGYQQYCCLGVCSVIARGVKKTPSFYGYSFTYPNDPDEGAFSGYPHAVWFYNRFGFDYILHIAEILSVPMSVPTLNDNRVPFGAIADVIEASVLKRKEVVITV